MGTCFKALDELVFILPSDLISIFYHSIEADRVGLGLSRPIINNLVRSVNNNVICDCCYARTKQCLVAGAGLPRLSTRIQEKSRAKCKPETSVRHTYKDSVLRFDKRMQTRLFFNLLRGNNAEKTSRLP